MCPPETQALEAFAVICEYGSATGLVISLSPVCILPAFATARFAGTMMSCECAVEGARRPPRSSPSPLVPVSTTPRYSERASEEEEDFGDRAGSWCCRRLAPWFTPFTNFMRAGRPAGFLLGLVVFECLCLLVYGARFVRVAYEEADDSWDPRNAAAYMAPQMVWGVALMFLVSDAVNSKSTLMLCAAGLKWCLPSVATALHHRPAACAAAAERPLYLEGLRIRISRSIPTGVSTFFSTRSCSVSTSFASSRSCSAVSEWPRA